MSNYTFTFKKDDVFVEFTTTDKDIVESQFKIWVAAADSYSRKNKPAPAGVQAPQSIKPAANPQQPANAKKVENSKNEVVDKAATPLKTINTIQPNPQPEATPPITTETPKNDATDFEAVLEQKIENSTFEPEVTKDPVFLNLVNSKNTTDKFHYLIITAYYLSEFEKQDRFSLKLINSKMMQNLSEVIDHSTLQEAINQNFIEVIPDLTGISDVAEYRLTHLGEEFFSNKI